MKKIILLSIGVILLCLSYEGLSQYHSARDTGMTAWVDSVMATLSQDEMIGQLLMVRANNPNEEYFSVIDQYIQKYGICGVTFFGGKPYRQAVQTNAWQKMSRVPLLVSIDAEWGLGMRLDSTVSFPYQMTLGAISDDSLLFRMGYQVGRQCKRLGIHMNFAPVVDINSNPLNPVIHVRSFGEDKERISLKGTAYMKGMMAAGLLVTAKHFPGHGDTDSDSHHTLPVIRHDRERLDSVELVPFRSLIEEGLSGIMIAHLYIPALEPEENIPSTLSGAIVTGLLREEMGFDGLVVTDALDMKGVTKFFAPGEIEVRALEAGNDILLLSADVPAAITAIRSAVSEGRIPASLVEEKCRKILEYKYMAGLNHPQSVDLNNLISDLNPVESKVLTMKLFEEAVTLVRNRDGLIPLTSLDTLTLASVAIGYGQETDFQKRLRYYAPIDNFALGREPSDSEMATLLEKLAPYNLVIVSVQNTGIWTANRFNISEAARKCVSHIQDQKRIILNIHASPYALSLFGDLPNAAAILVTYQDTPTMQDISAQAIFGGTAISGRLPVTATPGFPVGSGFDTKPTRLKYTLPEAIGISTKDLKKVDSLVNQAISKKAMPGCQVFAAKDGQVFFMKSYGKPTYNSDRQVNDFDLYDLASVTKAVASTPTLMKLKEEGRIDIDQMLVHYLPYLEGTNKAPIIIRDMMTHQARLKPWIPFYSYYLQDGQLDATVFSHSISEEFPVRVAEDLYIRQGFDRVIMDSIISSDLLGTSNYKYSDLGYYFLREIIELVTNQKLNDYVAGHFYRSLGLSTAGYLPRKHYPIDRLIPTENDLVFRKQLLQGDVHDQGAAMLGGVAGHAGMFSNANDLGIFMQMLLNGGSYGGKAYFLPETVQYFTQLQNPLNENRRGIGFDKPLIEYEKNGPACKSASRLSFGHSGFTGTYVWADPANGLVYVFLSNRVYPDATNNKLTELSIRTRIHQFFYDAIEKN